MPLGFAIFADLEKCKCYYGDSLGWPLPTNLEEVVRPNINKIEEDLQVDLWNSLGSIAVLNKVMEEPHICSGYKVYPFQTCNNVCGLVTMVMAAVLSNCQECWPGISTSHPQHEWLLHPSDYSDFLRITVMDWMMKDIVDIGILSEDRCDTNIHDGTNAAFMKHENDNMQTDYGISDDSKCNISDSDSDDFEESQSGTTMSKTKVPPLVYSSDSESDVHCIVNEGNIRQLLPEGYDYRFLQIQHKNADSFSFTCEFKIKLKSEQEARKWVNEYNEKTKETMVYERNRKGSGKHVVRKLFLRCHHNQRQTGKHSKSTRLLKTTFKEHSSKHTHCPAQMNVTIISSSGKCGKLSKDYLVLVNLKHDHNHPIHAADALRFRPIAEDTRKKYYDLFKLGRSPASAHLEYETTLMLKMDNPQVLADRNINPKVSDVYNIFNVWRKTNLGARNGKDVFEELERRVAIYNEDNKSTGGKAVVKRFSKSEDGSDQPLVLAICTPLMARVHEHVKQAGEIMFVDSSSSLDDFNNPMFTLSTSSAAGGLPLGVVITSGESLNIIFEAMTTLKQLFPKCSFGGKMYPDNILTDDCSPEREGLNKTWPSAKLFLCVFHFLQSMWRWLWNSKNSIDKDDKQYLMECVRKLVYAENTDKLEELYQRFKEDAVTQKYENFKKHLESYWERRGEWAICFRDQTLLRGNNTNNYAESGIRILKDIVFKRVKAYNLVQLFEFMTVTFELYYERRLLAVAHNRMDRYIALRFKGLGASKVNLSEIRESDSEGVYIVKSQSHHGVEYEVDTSRWHCTCTIAWTGKPTGEPCKHQAAVAKKYNLSSINYIPYFSSEGRYAYAVLAVGVENAGDKSFYGSLNDGNLSNDFSSGYEEKMDTHEDVDSYHDEGAANLDIMVGLLEENDKIKQLKDRVIQLRNDFISDVDSRIEQMDTQYLNGLCKFFTVYTDTIKKSEPVNSATPQLSSLLHSYFVKNQPASTCIAGTRRIKVQPTAIARRREGIARGSQYAPSGRPPKRKASGEDCHTQTKRGKQDHTKRKHSLSLNVKLNQPNPFKHGQGH